MNAMDPSTSENMTQAPTGAALEQQPSATTAQSPEGPPRLHPWNSPPTTELRQKSAQREAFVRTQMTELLSKFHKEKDPNAKKFARIRLEEARREFAKLSAWGAIADFHLGCAAGQHSSSMFTAFASALPSRSAEIINQFRNGAEREMLFDTESQEVFMFERVIAHVENEEEPRTISIATGPAQASGASCSESGIKVIKVLGKSADHLEVDPLRYAREFIIHGLVSKFGHRNILPLDRFYDTPAFSFAVMPYADSSLLDATRDRFRFSRKGFEEHAVQGMAAQMLASIEFLSNLGIAHRDISLENFCLSTQTGDILLLDFGLAAPLRLTSPESGEWAHISSSFTGKLNYMAPEVFHHVQGATLDPVASDIWSFGVCLFVLLTGNFPFDQPGPGCPRFHLRSRKGTAAVMRHLIAKGRVSDDLRVSPLFLDLLDRIFQTDPALRPGLAELRAHPFLRNR
ncbi:Protein kinase, putative [Hondaea fermentalgiana]|uniref:Protein kinase, putative n=1 Tax=Hondaea fermentalgiana TaxID=2315210 RepID=A0A2R5FZY9_9STRA|nr:Protein kinase, putative [Hondaea fermentalgiana]|eukprot:GBG24337.1 Protein kinase, putative [Hondaea fermentalgiana]